VESMVRYGSYWLLEASRSRSAFAVAVEADALAVRAGDDVAPQVAQLAVVAWLLDLPTLHLWSYRSGDSDTDWANL
jgi:hypothetical protein